MWMQTMKFNFVLIMMTILQIFGCAANSTHLESKTLHVGFNGSIRVNVNTFYENQEAIESSWLKSALTVDELMQLTRHVDFKKQFILVHTFGKRPNANGKIIMNFVRHTTDARSKQSNISTNISIGIADYKKCNIPVSIESFPFIVELVNRPKEDFKLVDGGYAAYNFGDGCKTPIEGKPTMQ
jgi:hypothetical protein